MGKFTPEDARIFYNRFGSKQDLQAFYENSAIEDLITHAGFEEAHAVFEFGFGTGRLAERLLSRHLPSDASYAGIDISATMEQLARNRLGQWLDRVTLLVSDGLKPIAAANGSFDRFVSTYVLDQMNEEDIRCALLVAYRVLKPGGRLCLASLAEGTSLSSCAVTFFWKHLYALRPKLVGGCRPVELLDYLDPERWGVEHRSVLSSFGITSEIVVASRKPS